jgi:putative hydroxymethylpyrimidine transporter CytX
LASEKTSLLGNGLLWFGAAISIAEILTGTFIAPLGFVKGSIAIILGHLIGCALMYFAGLIGGKTEKSAMETVKISFGSKGAIIFSALNIVQLIGWTAVMIISGARATGMVANPVFGTSGEMIWSIVIGVLIIIWILVGMKNLSKINIFVVGALFILTVILSSVVFKNGSAATVEGTMSFGAAVELSAAMPLSWLPLISDYVKKAKRPVAATFVSAAAYFAGSCWMYIIGLGAAIFAGESDIAKIMLQAGIGFIGIYIIIAATVTTTFLDAFSAGVSFKTITSRFDERIIAIVITAIGIFIAMFTPIEQYENFLFLIGSVFAPMIAILITDFFILKKDHTQEGFNISNLILWAAGFVIYRMFLTADT